MPKEQKKETQNTGKNERTFQEVLAKLFILHTELEEEQTSFMEKRQAPALDLLDCLLFYSAGSSLCYCYSRLIFRFG